MQSEARGPRSHGPRCRPRASRPQPCATPLQAAGAAGGHPQPCHASAQGGQQQRLGQALPRQRPEAAPQRAGGGSPAHGHVPLPPAAARLARPHTPSYALIHLTQLHALARRSTRQRHTPAGPTKTQMSGGGNLALLCWGLPHLTHVAPQPPGMQAQKQRGGSKPPGSAGKPPAAGKKRKKQPESSGSEYEVRSTACPCCCCCCGGGGAACAREGLWAGVAGRHPREAAATVTANPPAPEAPASRTPSLPPTGPRPPARPPAAPAVRRRAGVQRGGQRRRFCGHGGGRR
jgi:hypothetical protein